MDYTVHQDPKALDSTGYMEIGPGKYAAQHWQYGFLFIREDAFSVSEGIVLKYFPDYDHYGTNDIPRMPGLAIASELRSAAQSLKSASAVEVSRLLALPSWQSTGLDSELAAHRSQMRAMLDEIASALEQAYRAGGYACILGM